MVDTPNIDCLLAYALPDAFQVFPRGSVCNVAMRSSTGRIQANPVITSFQDETRRTEVERCPRWKGCDHQRELPCPSVNYQPCPAAGVQAAELLASCQICTDAPFRSRWCRSHRHAASRMPADWAACALLSLASEHGKLTVWSVRAKIYKHPVRRFFTSLEPPTFLLLHGRQNTKYTHSQNNAFSNIYLPTPAARAPSDLSIAANS